MRHSLVIVLLTACHAASRSNKGTTTGSGSGSTGSAASTGSSGSTGSISTLGLGVDSHSDGQIITGARAVTLFGHISDTATVTLTATVNGASVTPAYTQTTFSLAVTLADNQNTVVISGADSAGGSGSVTLTLNYPFVALQTYQNAKRVLGQPTPESAIIEMPGANGLLTPYGRPALIHGSFYVSDSGRNRVLVFDGAPTTNNQNAAFVIGPSDFAAGAANNQFARPQSVATDGTMMFITDYSNNRVLAWHAAPTQNTAADFVLGQSDFALSASDCTRESLYGPEDAFVVAGKLVVTDSDNSRVLIWNQLPATSGTLPDIVLGQGDFTHCAANDDSQTGTEDPTPTGRVLDYPDGVWSDGTQLFIADSGNNRVLVWNLFPTTSFTPADFAIGQTDLLSNNGTLLSGPYFLNGNGNQLALADYYDNRVLLWNGALTANRDPDIIIGQTALSQTGYNDDNQDGITDATTGRTLDLPTGVALLGDALWVTDNGNGRALEFVPQTRAPCSASQAETPPGSGTCVDNPCGVGACAARQSCDNTTGAAVCSSCILFVDAAASGTGDGSSWQNAVTDLTRVYVNAPAGAQCEAWVKKGTYYAYLTSSTDSIVFGSQLYLYGGFAGSETARGQRNPFANPTILDGTDGGANAVGSVTTSEGDGSLTFIDGFTVQNGSGAYGAGLMVQTATEVDNCTFQNNQANGGGAIDASGDDLTVNNSLFESNSASQGGAILDAGTTIITLSNTTFSNNTSLDDAGAIFTESATSITGCTFTNNTAGTSGGALALHGVSTIFGSIFSGNQAAANDGGAIWSSMNGTLTGSRFLANTSGGNGGAVYLTSEGVTDSTWTIGAADFIGNNASGGGGAIARYTAAATITNSVFAGNLAAANGGAIYGEFDPLLLVNCTLYANSGNDGGGVFSYDATANVSNSIVWANSPDNLADSIIAIGQDDNDTATNPMFASLPKAWGWATSGSTSTIIETSTAAAAVSGDILVLADSGIGVPVDSSNSTSITVSMGITPPPSGTLFFVWPAGTTNLTPDFHLTANSAACIDLADSAVAPATDKEGHARDGAGPDIGAYEY